MNHHIVAIFFFTFLLAANAIPAADNTGLQTDHRRGLHTVTIDSMHGSISIYLPSDIALGDMVFGTVSAAPSGDNQETRQDNADHLTGYVVEITTGESPVTAKEGRVNLTIPAQLAEDVIRVVVKSDQGKPVGSVVVPVLGSQEYTPSKISIPAVGQPGRPVVIEGPFDGSPGTTTVTIGDKPAEVIAESPRKTVVNAPRDLSGLLDVKVTEGETMASGSINLLALNMEIKQEHLLRGQKTIITVRITGFGEVPRSAFPVHFDLTNQSPEVVRFEGIDQTIVRALGPGDINSEGAFEMTVPLDSHGVGAFSISSLIFADWPIEPGFFESPMPEDDAITCPAGGGGDVAPGAAPVDYDFTKDGIRPLDQHHKTEWGDRYCVPTATAASLTWFAEHGGDKYKGLTPDSNSNSRVDDDDAYAVVERLAGLSHTTAASGSFAFDWQTGLHRYLKEKGLDDEFTVKNRVDGDMNKAIEASVAKWKGKEQELGVKIKRFENKLEELKKKLADAEKKQIELQKKAAQIKQQRDAAKGEEKERLNKQYDALDDQAWDLDEEIMKLREIIPKIIGVLSQWRTMADLVEHWEDMKKTHSTSQGKPDYDFYTSELKAGEDVIVRIAMPQGHHVMVGQAYDKDKNTDGTWNAGMVDPASGKKIDTQMREQGGQLQVKYKSAWRNVISIWSISPRK